MSIITDEDRACLVDDCAGEQRGRGLCERHYRALREHGHPLGPDSLTPVLRPLSTILLPVEPIARAVTKAGSINALVANCGLDELAHRRWAKQISRAIKAGSVTADVADRLALEILGANPGLVWGADWWKAEDAYRPVAGQ